MSRSVSGDDHHEREQHRLTALEQADRFALQPAEVCVGARLRAERGRARAQNHEAQDCEPSDLRQREQ